MKTKLTIDIFELLIVAIFALMNWTSLLPLFPLYSPAYWMLFGLTIAYLILLLVKFIRKHALNLE